MTARVNENSNAANVENPKGTQGVVKPRMRNMGIQYLNFDDNNMHETMKVVSTNGDLVSSSLRVLCVPGMANVVALLGVPLNTLGDIDNLTKAIDLGKLEVWSTLPSENRTEVMETIWAMWDDFLTENPNATSGYSSNPGKIDVGIGESLTCVEGVAAFFRVPIKTQVDYENFAKGIEKGTYEVWSKLTREQRKAILKTARDGWNNLVELKKKATMFDKQSGEVSLDDLIIKIINVNEKSSSYVSAAGGSILDPIKPKSNFRSLSSDNLFEGVNISIPRKIVKTVSSRLANTLYGYFIGKRIAFPVVEYFVRNNWGKYGLTRIMMNSKGFFFFQFKTLKGLEDVLENGPWMIRKSPIILKKWNMSTRLCKDELSRIPVWVKIHDVPIQAFTEDGLSIIASKLGKPIMLDSYTSSMCIESWGRSSFARCLIEINAEDVLQDSLTIGIPCEDDGFSIETVSIEYEWKPPRCDLCKIFGHSHDCCPKKVLIPNAETSNVITPNVVNTSTVPTPLVQKTNDGFQTVGKKKKKKGKSKSNVVGPSIKQNVRYEPKASTSAPKKTTTNVGNVSNSSSLLKNMVNSSNQDNITSSNSFAALNKDIEDEEEVENVFDETANLFNSKTGERSSFTAVG
ncbi:zinc knuckle CX2CX4HX4C containing protein [Tanacetum coccineum]